VPNNMVIKYNAAVSPTIPTEISKIIRTAYEANFSAVASKIKPKLNFFQILQFFLAGMHRQSSRCKWNQTSYWRLYKHHSGSRVPQMNFFGRCAGWQSMDNFEPVDDSIVYQCGGYLLFKYERNGEPEIFYKTYQHCTLFKF